MTRLYWDSFHPDGLHFIIAYLIQTDQTDTYRYYALQLIKHMLQKPGCSLDAYREMAFRAGKLFLASGDADGCALLHLEYKIPKSWMPDKVRGLISNKNYQYQVVDVGGTCIAQDLKTFIEDSENRFHPSVVHLYVPYLVQEYKFAIASGSQKEPFTFYAAQLLKHMLEERKNSYEKILFIAKTVNEWFRTKTPKKACQLLFTTFHENIPETYDVPADLKNTMKKHFKKKKFN